MPGPLHGLKILDFTTLLPGPFATLNLADLGAEVLRIGSPSRPDLNAQTPPFLPGSGLAANLAYLGRNKRSITLNLKHPAGVEIIHRLLADYDILIEQFRPGVMQRLGLGYQALAEVEPSLIYCSLSGYGQNGPLRDRAGHDINYLALSGLMAHSGGKEQGPKLTGTQIADLASGSYGTVIAVLAAVVHRQRTGEGQYLDVAMTDGMVPFNAVASMDFLVEGVEPQREGYFLNGGSLYDFYRTADHEYLSFGGLEPKFFAAFCRAIGREDLIPGTVSPPNLEEVKPQVRRIIASKTRAQWQEVFREADACLEPVVSLGEALNSPLGQARGWLVEVRGQGGEKIRQPANPLKFSRTPPEYGPAGVPAGTHNQEVLRELGYSPEELTQLEKDGLFR
ncbi:MAG: CoA transferase [Desulfarculaceae bacterium]|nr:CoA transferase [Desulfarculaceae bacterium]MCF8071192.1 CoA transferase [Desulfarculaceae bacterium]MCF8101205.1 CoA transferase [Desulfarculaceae bacterium]MCF8115246.1 CoA transferase [Desulfarculaceae bacterium]